MTNFAALLQPDRGEPARLIHLVDKTSYADWLKKRPPADRALLEAHPYEEPAYDVTELANNAGPATRGHGRIDAAPARRRAGDRPGKLPLDQHQTWTRRRFDQRGCNS